MAKKVKRPSNNPLGRKPSEDKKELVGIYIAKSVIDKYGDKEAIREIFRKAIEN